MADTTSFEALMRIRYSPAPARLLTLQKRPVLASIPKVSDFGGIEPGMWIPTIYSDGGGGSADFSASIDNQDSDSQQARFTISRAKEYRHATMSNILMMATKGPADAWVPAVTRGFDAAINKVSNRIEASMFRTGFGEKGTVKSHSGSTITLVDSGDCAQWDKGEKIVFSASVSSNVLNNSGASLIVAGVDRIGGVITFTTAVSNALVADGDTCFTKGDRQDSATPSPLKYVGFEGWLPYGGPSATLFNGVDRTVDSRLSGLWLDGTQGQLVREALLDAVRLVAQHEGAASKIYVNHAHSAQLEHELEGQFQYIDLKMNNQMIGCRGLQINSPEGPVQVLPSKFCPANRAYVIDDSTWKLHLLGDLVNVFDADGLTMLRQDTVDGVRFQVFSYGQLACDAPIRNCVVKLPSKSL